MANRVYDSILDSPLPEEIEQYPQLWEKRFKHVHNFEEYLADNGCYIIKVYLHLSKSAQKKRLLERLEIPDQNLVFFFSDLEDRKIWAKHEGVFEDTFRHTSIGAAP